MDIGRGDLDSRSKIHDLVVDFYRQVAMDDLLGPVFNEVAEVDWAAHIPRLVDYWCRVLLDEPGYDGYILRPHERIHRLEPLTPELFDRWYELFVASIETSWRGPTAQRAKDHAERIARMLSRRLASHAWRPRETARLVTPVTTLLGVEHPVLLAPMGDSAGGRLAGAVSDAGGLGLIGGGYADPDWLRRELDHARGARVGVGFITFALDERPGTLEIALDAGIPAVQLSFGDPRPYAPRIKAAGALLLCQVQSADDVHRAIEADADVLIAQGQDAGGHGRPDRATMGLVPSIVDRVRPVPVVAAGGIADGRGLAAALSLGAAGVSLGTRFLATVEALSSPAERRSLVARRSDDTVRTSVIDEIRGPAWPDGHDGRLVRNDLVDRWHGHLDELPAHAEALRRAYGASPSDDYDIRALWAGEGLDLIDRIEAAGDVVESVVAQAVTQIDAVAAIVRRIVPPPS